MTSLDRQFWNEKYKNNRTGWDLGEVSPPLKNYIDQLDDRSQSILIPGAGNAYEADYLIEKGFKALTIIDIAPKLVQQLKTRFHHDNVTIIEGDFFEHEGNYDLILEQTFFCALPPEKRSDYVRKMHDLLRPDGRLCGVLFDRQFDGGPPFGGSEKEYRNLFEGSFSECTMERCYNSHPARQGAELWINLKQ